MVSKLSILKWVLAGFFLLVLFSAAARAGLDFTAWILYLLNNTVLWIPDPRAGFAWTYPRAGTFWGLFIPLGVPLIFYLTGLPFALILVNMITAPKKIERGEATLGKAYILNRQKHIFKEILFKKGQAQIEHNKTKYNIDPDRFVFLTENPLSTLFLPRRVPHLYFDSGRSEPLDIEYVRKAQRYKKFNPVQMRLVVQENLTEGFFKSLVVAAGRRVVKVRYVLIIFVAVAGLIILLNHYFPGLFRGLPGA